MYKTTVCVGGACALALVLALTVEPPCGVPDADPEAAALTEELDAQFRASEQRREARREIARAVVEERMTFATATREYFTMLFTVPGDVEVARTRYPDATDDELAARQLIAFVNEVHLPAGKRAAVTARLDAEYRAHFGRPLVQRT
jgi:hypothetical protein